MKLGLVDQGGSATHLLDEDPAPVPAPDSVTGLIDLPAPSPSTAPATDLIGSSLTLPSSDHITGLKAAAEPSQQSQPPSTTDVAAERQLYIVFLDNPGPGSAPGLAARVQQLLGDNPAQDLLDNLNGFTAMLTAAQAKGLQHAQGVLSVEADRMVTLVQPVDRTTIRAAGSVSASSQTTPYGVPMVWGNVDYATANNSGKYAFVLDTGVSTSTGDLNVNSAYSRNFARSGDSSDYNGHGTHVAGTIAAINDADGVVGVAAGANIISIRVLDRNGSGWTSWIVNGINYVAGLVKTGGALAGISIADLVANMSLGGSLNSSIDNAVRAAATPDSNGRYLRFALAAGNSAADVDKYSPAATGDHVNIYTVSAVDSSRIMASWSNYDDLRDSVDDCDFSAPGVNVVSLGMTEGSLVSMSGTSMAAPHMAGALLMGTVLTDPLSTPVISGASGDPFAYLS